jgi:TetR/AcrR family transcriptional regulator, regulator of biofilm formation and stress response
VTGAAGKRSNPRRHEILEAALRLIGRHGVDGVTHRMVAREAGLPLASTTYYFDSKRALVEEALELMSERSTELARHHTATAARIDRDEVVDRIVAFAMVQLEDPDALLLAQYELMLEAGRRPHLRPLAHRWSIAYMDCFAGMVARAGIPRPQRAAELLMTYVEGALVSQVGAPVDGFAEGHLRPLLTELLTGWCLANPDG